MPSIFFFKSIAEKLFGKNFTILERTLFETFLNNLLNEVKEVFKINGDLDMIKTIVFTDCSFKDALKEARKVSKERVRLYGSYFSAFAF